MHFTTDLGAEYDVDLKAKTCVRTCGEVAVAIPFDKVSGIYIGSEEGKFSDNDGSIIVSGEIISVAGSPDEFAVGEQGNVTFKTRNSTYEVNQEEKLFRRLAGLNPSCHSIPDGEWLPYTTLFLNLNSVAIIEYQVEGKPHNIQTSRVREIEGTFVEPPPVLAVAMTLVDAAHPPL